MTEAAPAQAPAQAIVTPLGSAMATPLGRALGYPYPRFAGHFALIEGEPVALRGIEPGAARSATLVDGTALDRHLSDRGVDPGLLDDMVAVLASGSNASPLQLARKYAEKPGSVVLGIAVEAVGLLSVYSAHIAHYGSVAATLMAAPGAHSDLVLTLIPRSLLNIMHVSEGARSRDGNYRYVELFGATLSCDGVAWTGQVFAYASQHGALTIDGRAIRLAEVPARGTTMPALDQRGVQMALIAALGLDDTVEAFVAANLDGEAVRVARAAAMRQRLSRPAILSARPVDLTASQG